jgi:hypothetical protein
LHFECKLLISIFKQPVLRPSLRANGSRERAPDDRLREAIHRAAQRKNGLLRRFRLRSLSYGGQVAPRNDIKLKYDSAFPRRDASGFLQKPFAQERGRRECRVPPAPAASRANLSEAHERSHHRFTGTFPAFPTQWFTAYTNGLKE